MKQETIQIFTRREEEFISLLTRAGTKKSVAAALVFLASRKKASSHEIERGADLRQPEVSVAMKVLIRRGWVTRRKISPPSPGRPARVFELVKPVSEILDSIWKDKVDALKEQMVLIGRLKEFAGPGLDS